MLNYSIHGQNRFESILLLFLKGKQTVSQNVKPKLFHQYLIWIHDNFISFYLCINKSVFWSFEMCPRPLLILAPLLRPPSPSTLPFISAHLSFRGSHSLLCVSLTPLSQWSQWFLMPSLCSALNTGNFLCLLMWWKASACHNTWEGPYYDNYEQGG